MLIRIRKDFILICLLILFICIYLYNIISSILKIGDVFFLLKALEKYLNSATLGSYGYLIPRKNYSSSLKALLLRYPRINQHLGVNCPNLTYGKRDDVNYSNAAQIYTDLLMQRNYYLSDLIRSLNPLTALQKLLRIPSAIVKELGFSPSNKNFKFINLFGWCIAYFFNMYSDEIKAFINFIFQVILEYTKR